MSLRDFARSVEPDDMSYDECDGPIDDGLMEWPASDLEYIVYYDPDRQPELDFEAIEKEVLAEIAPRYRVVYFERLRAETLRSWSPFATRTVEEDFLARGYGRGPVTGLNAPQGPAALRRRHDYLTHHQARAESLVAMRCLGYVNRSILTSVQALVPVRERPNWLRRSLGEILTPVCGRASRAAGDELDVPDLPLTSRDGLLLACDRLDARRTVHPAVSTTPDTVERMGRRDLRRWCALNHDAVNLRIRQELADPNRYFGGAFDPCAAALWQSQTVMELRIALAEMERRLLANNPAAGDVDAEQNTNFRVKLDNDFGKDNPAYREPQIAPAAFGQRARSHGLRQPGAHDRNGFGLDRCGARPSRCLRVHEPRSKRHTPVRRSHGPRRPSP